jgi:hypothetical protein
MATMPRMFDRYQKASRNGPLAFLLQATARQGELLIVSAWITAAHKRLTFPAFSIKETPEFPRQLLAMRLPTAGIVRWGGGDR